MKRWPTKPLSELCDVEGGNAAPQGDEHFTHGTIPFVRMKDLGRPHFTNNLTETDDKLTEASATANRMKFFEPGCILFPRSGSVALNHRAVLGVRACIVSHIGVLQKLRPEIAAGYLYLYLTTFDMTALSKKTTGVDSIAFSDVKRIPIPVPPLAEQERIVKLLDEADELRKLRAQADRRTAALLPALFHEMFGGGKFRPVRVGELTSLVTSGSTPRGGDEVYTSEGPYFIRSQNVQMNRLDLSQAACLPAEVHEQMARTKVAQGDVLLNITGASIGRVAWVDQLDREANVSQHVCLIRSKPDMLTAAYLSVFISLPATQRFILQIQAGASRQALNHQQVRTLEIPLPPLPLQQEFAQRVAEIRELEAGQAASRQRLKALFQSLLHRAFNGEL